MKKSIFIALFIIPVSFNCFAEVYAFPIKNQLNVVSEKELNMSAQFKDNLLKRKKEMEIKGYNEVDNRYAKYLLTLKKNAPDEIRAYRETTDTSDTHLKTSIDVIKLLFSLPKLPIADADIIGYAPIGTYISKPKEGWNGVKVFFNNKKLGICAFEYTDLNLSHGGVLMVKEDIKNTINKKPAFIVKEGSVASGFTYSVVWYNGIKVNRLDCASQIFEKDLTTKMITLATKIDSKVAK